MNLRKDHSHAVRFLSSLVRPSGPLALAPLKPRPRAGCHDFTSFPSVCGPLRPATTKKVFFAAMNVLARVTTKDVANCDTHCELRSSGNQQKVERKRRLGLPRGVSGSVFKIFHGTRTVSARSRVARSRHRVAWAC